MSNDLETLLSAEISAWTPAPDLCPPAEDLAAWIEDREGALEAHLAACAACRADVLAVAGLLHEQTNPPLTTCAPREGPRRRRGLSRRSARQRSGRHSQRHQAENPAWIVWAQVAAAAAVLLLVMLTARDASTPQPQTGARLSQPARGPAPTLVSSVRARPSPQARSEEASRPETELASLGDLFEEALSAQDEPSAGSPWEDQAWDAPTTSPRPEPAREFDAPAAVAPDPAPPAPVAEAPQVVTASAPRLAIEASGVRVRRAGRVGWTDLERTPVLQAGDKLRGDSRGGVISLASVQLYLAPRARVEVADDLSLALVRGQALLVGEGSLGTPAGQVRVDGETLLAVSRDRLGLRVLNGVAHCAHGSGQIQLSSGQDLLASARQASPPLASSASGIELPRWANSLPRPTSVGAAPGAVGAPVLPPNKGGDVKIDIGGRGGQESGRGRRGRDGSGARDGQRGGKQRGSRGSQRGSNSSSRHSSHHSSHHSSRGSQ